MLLSYQYLKGRILDEMGDTSSSTLWSNGQLVRAINRELVQIASNYPVRITRMEVVGDGVRDTFELPETLYRIEGVTSGNTVIPPIPYIDAQATVFGRTTLAPDLYSSYGYAFSPPNSIRFSPVLSVNERRQVTGYGESGYFFTLNDVFQTYNTGTISVVNGSTSVTGSGVYWSQSVTRKQVILIAGVPYLISYVSGPSSLELTEPYRGNTASGLSYSIGAYVMYPQTAESLLVYGVIRSLLRSVEDVRYSVFDNEYTTAKRVARAAFERLANDYARYA